MKYLRWWSYKHVCSRNKEKQSDIFLFSVQCFFYDIFIGNKILVLINVDPKQYNKNKNIQKPCCKKCIKQCIKTMYKARNLNDVCSLWLNPFT